MPCIGHIPLVSESLLETDPQILVRTDCADEDFELDFFPSDGRLLSRMFA